MPPTNLSARRVPLNWRPSHDANTSMSQDEMPPTAVREQALDVRDYLRPVWRRKWLILAIVVLATGGTYALARRAHSQRDAHRAIHVEHAGLHRGGRPGGADRVYRRPEPAGRPADVRPRNAVHSPVDYTGGLPPSRHAGGQCWLGQRRSLQTRSATAFGTSIIAVQATSSTAKLAALLANTYVSEFLASRGRAEAAAAHADATATSAQINSLPNSSSNASELRTLRLQLAQYDEIVRNPNPGAYQVSPAPLPAATIITSGSSRTPDRRRDHRLRRQSPARDWPRARARPVRSAPPTCIGRRGELWPRGSRRPRTRVPCSA